MSQANAAGSPSEFLMHGLERDARALMDVDPAGAHVVLGGVASLRWDVDRIRHHYRIALQHRETAETFYNYSVALTNVEDRAGAYEAGAAAHGKAPDDRFLLDNVIGLALDGGYFATGRSLCDRWYALTAGEDHDLAHSFERLAHAASGASFSEVSVRVVLDILGGVQREARVRSVSSVAKEDPRQPGAFLYEQHVEATPEEAQGLNASFVDLVVARRELITDPGYRFVPILVGMRV